MTQTQMTDPRGIHQRAMTQTESIVAAVTPAQLTLPTPCAEYDVRTLLSHVVGGLHRIAVMGEGGDALAVPARADGVRDDGWLAAYRAARLRVEAAWADDARLDALVEVPWGKPARAARSRPRAGRSPPSTRPPRPTTTGCARDCPRAPSSSWST